jgi:hypothetical protein
VSTVHLFDHDFTSINKYMLSFNMPIGTSKPDRISIVNWLHKIDSQDFELQGSATIVHEIDSLPPIRVRTRVDQPGKIANTKGFHLFPRLHGRSFVDPANVPPAGIGHIYELCVDANTDVAAGTLQLLAVLIT